MEQIKGLDMFSDECFRDSLKLIHALTGITIAPNRKSMVHGRLRKRAVALKLDSYETYLDLVKSDNNEKVVFIDIVTTNETYFFRTPRIWAYLQEVFLPDWISKNPDRKFSAWSAAASSGDEGHSLGILLQAMKDKNPKFSYEILGTDISQEMVRTCQTGVYKGRSIGSFKTTRPEWFHKYMKSQGSDEFQVTPEIKSRLKFQQHNLFKPLVSTQKFDLVLLRNVLIYFTDVDQEKVLKLIEPRLSDTGILIIGESESLTNIQTGYSNIQPLIYKKAA